MTTDPRINALAQEASAKIKSVSDLPDSEISAIYQQFCTKADVIRGTSDSLSSSADSQPQSQKTH